MNTPEEAVAYLEEMRLLLRELGVSDCEMQEGSLRCDANVNVHVPQPDGTVAATPLVEIKNLNSFRAVGRAIAYEAKRQYEEFQKDPASYRFGKLLEDDRRAGTTPKGVHRACSGTRRRPPTTATSPSRTSCRSSVTAEQIDGGAGRDGRAAGGAAARGCRRSTACRAYDAGVLTAKGRAMVAYFEEVAKARRRRQGGREPHERPGVPGAGGAQGGDRRVPDRRRRRSRSS